MFACHAVTVEVFAIAIERAAASAVEWAATSVAWAVASAAGWDICVAWAGVDKLALVDTAARSALAVGSVLAVSRLL